MSSGISSEKAQVWGPVVIEIDLGEITPSSAMSAASIQELVRPAGTVTTTIGRSRPVPLNRSPVTARPPHR